MSLPLVFACTVAASIVLPSLAVAWLTDWGQWTGDD